MSETSDAEFELSLPCTDSRFERKMFFHRLQEFMERDSSEFVATLIRNAKADYPHDPELVVHIVITQLQNSKQIVTRAEVEKLGTVTCGILLHMCMQWRDMNGFVTDLQCSGKM